MSGLDYLRARATAERLKGSKPSLERAAAIEAELTNCAEPAHHQRETFGHVYFIRCGSSVKIGFSTNVESRLADFATGSPDEPALLLSVHGTMKTERQFHERFAGLRKRREWFRLDGDLLAFLREAGCDV